MSTALTTNVDARALKSTKFPAEFNVKVDMKKVNIPVIKIWAADKIARLLNSDDDVVPELVFDMLESHRYPNIKELQINLTGFLDKDAPKFCSQLWNLCISAEKSPQGVPKELLEAKKQELERERVEEEKARAAAMQRQDAERKRERELDDIRQRERADRPSRMYNNAPGRGHGREAAPPPRRSSPRRSRSPRYHDRDDRKHRGGDSYAPSRRPYREEHRQRRSPSYDRRRSPVSRSPSPKRRRRSLTTSRSPSPKRRRRSSSASDRPRRAYSPRHRYDRNTRPRQYDRRERSRDRKDARQPRRRRNTSSPLSSRRTSSSSPPPPPTRDRKKQAAAAEDLMPPSQSGYRKDARRLSRGDDDSEHDHTDQRAD